MRARKARRGGAENKMALSAEENEYRKSKMQPDEVKSERDENPQRKIRR